MSLQFAEQPGGAGEVWGCVLIGGKSERMGCPKHLLLSGGVTWLEVIVGKLRERAGQVVVSGMGDIPPALEGITAVDDAPGLRGPLAGILGLFRQLPGKSWLVVACDMPELEVAALDWLLEQRSAGVRAILPDLRGDGRVEPLLAYYDRSCGELLEQAASSGAMRPAWLAGKPGVLTPCPPLHLCSSWRNLNSRDDLIA